MLTEYNYLVYISFILFVSSTLTAAQTCPAEQMNKSFFLMAILDPDHCENPRLLLSTWTPVPEHRNLAYSAHFCAQIPLLPLTLPFSTKTRTSSSLSAAEICVECQRSWVVHGLYAFALIVNVAHLSKQFHPLCRFMPRSVDVWSEIISRLYLSDK